MQDPLYHFIFHHNLDCEPKDFREWLRQYPGGVYFLHSPTVGLTKVGKADNFAVRLNNLQNANADRLVFVGAASRRHSPDPYRTPSIQLEWELHTDFADQREHGEWFRLDDPHAELWGCRVSSHVMLLGCTVHDYLTLLSDLRRYDEWRAEQREIRKRERAYLRSIGVGQKKRENGDSRGRKAS